jgi:hypothetical protein
MCVRVDVVRLVGMSLALALCVSMSGCKKKSGESTSPGVDGGGEAQAPHDSADPLAELASLEGRMRAFGLPVAADENEGASDKGATMQHEEGEDRGMSDAASAGAGGDDQPAPVAEEAPASTAQVPPTGPARDEVNYCGDLCSLSESICTLEVRICSLAESHANDSLYADACERAVEDCEVAGQACDGCG